MEATLSQDLLIEELEDVQAPGGFWDGFLTGVGIGAAVAGGIGVGVAIAT